MFRSIVSEVDFKFMFHLIDIILGPFLTLRFDFLKRIEFDFVFRGVDKLLLDVVLLGKSVEPKSTPDISYISHHRKRTFV